MAYGSRARRRSALPPGLAVALAINGGALLILTRAHRGPARLAVSAPMQFRLIRLALRPHERSRPQPAAARSATAEPQARPHLASAVPTAAPAQAPPQPATAAAPPGQGQPGPGAAADLGRILRARLGCNDPSGLRLTPEERARCAARLGAGARQAGFIPAPIDPDKRAWFDALHAAYTPRDPMDGALPIPLGCKIRFNGPKSKFKPPHSLKIPGLPCYVIPPRGVLTEESAVAPPEHVETRLPNP